MSFIWLNVTTIHSWRRPAVGIVRVESECAKYALQQGDLAVRYCRYDGHLRQYLEVPAQEVRHVLKRIRETTFNAPKASESSGLLGTGSASAQAMSLEQRAVAFVMRLIYALPTTLQRHAFSFAAARAPAFPAAIRAAREIQSSLRHFFWPEHKNIAALPPLTANRPDRDVPSLFAPGDVYVSLGLDWDQKDDIQLYELRQRIGFKTLLFCYDIIPVKLPHLCVGDVSAKFAMYFANLAWSADKILCISQWSRNDLHQLLVDLGAPVPPMDVVRLGCDIQSPVGDAVSSDVANLLGQRYILFVSTIERRKNHETLYRAYTLLVDKGVLNLPQLVFVGLQGWGVGDLLADLRLDPRIKQYVNILNHVTDDDLVRLYSSAYFTVYPSLYEGWGLPVAESLAHGKLCLATTAASVPEVGGTLIDYIDPWDVDSWAQKIQWYCDNPQDLRAREERIRRDYKVDSWSYCAKFILESLKPGV